MFVTPPLAFLAFESPHGLQVAAVLCFPGDNTDEISALVEGRTVDGEGPSTVSPARA